MVRDSRIKQMIFNKVMDGNVNTAYHSDQDANDSHINGEILSVDTNFDRTGSIALSISGIGVEFYRNNAPSGAAWTHTQPREFTQAVAGSIANAEHVPFIANGPIILTAGSMASGTIPLQVSIMYR